MDPIAHNYFRAADGHRTAALLLHPHVRVSATDTPAVFLAFYNVLGFAFELYLKAFLVGSGYSSDTLARRPFGHNLHQLLDTAISEGLAIERPALEKIINYIGPHHGDYSYRYISEEPGYEFTYIVDMDPVFTVLERLHHGIGTILQSQSASRAI